jgi:hypothetical protein
MAIQFSDVVSVYNGEARWNARSVVQAADQGWIEDRMKSGLSSAPTRSALSAFSALPDQSLEEAANVERLSRCDATARVEINRRIAVLVARQEIAS